MENVVVLGFDESSRAYQALSVLKQLHANGKLRLEDAGVVSRGADGQMTLQDGATAGTAGGTTTGTLLGALFGIIAGPLGVLLGGTTGMLVGSTVDLADAAENQIVLGQMMQVIPPGATSVVAIVDETGPEALDAAIGELHGTVLRRAVADVQAEVSAVAEAQAAAAREARKVLRRQHRDEVHQKIDGWKDEVKASFERLKARIEGGKDTGKSA